MTIVRRKVAKSELRPAMPTLAKIAVSAAKIADSAAQNCQACISDFMARSSARGSLNTTKPRPWGRGLPISRTSAAASGRALIPRRSRLVRAATIPNDAGVRVRPPQAPRARYWNRRSACARRAEFRLARPGSVRQAAAGSGRGFLGAARLRHGFLDLGGRVPGQFGLLETRQGARSPPAAPTPRRRPPIRVRIRRARSRSSRPNSADPSAPGAAKRSRSPRRPRRERRRREPLARPPSSPRSLLVRRREIAADFGHDRETVVRRLRRIGQYDFAGARSPPRRRRRRRRRRLRSPSSPIRLRRARLQLALAFRLRIRPRRLRPR